MDIIIIGFLLGGSYALMSMGMQLQYGVARIMNLANGEFLVAGSFGAFWFFTGAKLSPFFSLVVVVPVDEGGDERTPRNHLALFGSRPLQCAPDH